MFEFLFKYPRSAFDAGELSLTSGWPLWLGVALLLIIAVVLAFSLWRQRQHLSAPRLSLLWLLQTAVMALALLMLWQPALTLTSVRAGENAVALVLDNSASMAFADAERPRRDQAVELLSDNLSPDLADIFQLESLAFGDELQPIESFDELPAGADSTHMADALLEVLDQARATPLAAVIIATDGNDTDSAPDADFWDRLASFGVPVHTVGYGEDLIAGDVEIAKVDLAPRTLPGSVERATVTLRYRDPGAARIRVYAGSDLVAVEEVELTAEASEISRSIDLPSGGPGLQELRFEVVGDADDRVPDNNTRQRLLQVADEQRRILYFEGDPRWEYKFMRRAVHDADGLSLVSLLRTTPNKFYRQGITEASELENGFPATKADLYRYDAVIIGNVESVSLNSVQQQLLHDYVAERGGSLMMLAGSSALADGGWQDSPLAAALPVLLPRSGGAASYVRKRARVQLTSEGSFSPITRLDDDDAENLRLWSQMPELADYQLTGPLKPGAQALLALELPTGSQPLLSHQRYGRGHSYVLATAGTWRWQMQLPSEDLNHEIFWRQLLNALSTTTPQRIEVSLPGQVFRDESQVQVSATALDENFDAVTDAELSVTVKSPDGSTRQLPMTARLDQPGRYEATIDAPQTGSWQLDVGAQFEDDQLQTTRWFSREDGTAEVFALARDSNFLQRIADTTGGRYWPAGDTGALAETLQTDSSGLTRQQTRPLWNAPIFFLLLLGLKLLEWLLRLIWRRL